MQLLNAAGKWQACDAARVGTELKKGQQQRRAYAAYRGKSGAQSRAMDIAIQRSDRSDRIARVKMKRVERELGLLDHHRHWGKPLRIRAPRPIRRALDKALRAVASRSVRFLPTYRRALRDKRGRVAVFMRVRYMGFNSPKWADGCPAEHIVYTLREGALHIGENASGWLSNMGDDAAEIAAAWKVLEEVEKGYRTNAIVQYRIVVNLSHELTAAQQQNLVESFCERTFGRLGLPYVAAIHKPDVEGDSRNYHAHICFSTRPLDHIGSFEWSIAQEKVNQLTDRDGLKLMRAQFAAVSNLALRGAGLQERYTHQSYAERGIDARRTDHNGPERTAAYRRGESVDMVSRNTLLIDRNEAVEDVRIAQARCGLAEKRDGLAESLAKSVAQRNQLVRIANLVEAIGATGRNGIAGIREATNEGMRASLERQRYRALAVSRQADTISAIFTRSAEAADQRDLLEERRAKAEQLRQQAARAETIIRETEDSAVILNRLHALRQWALDAVESATGKLGTPTGSHGNASLPIDGVVAPEPIRVDEPKEKLVRELSWDEGASLIERLERDRPLLEAKNGVIQPVDTRPFTEAELAWMRRDLAMHRLLFQQQQEQEAAEERKEEVRRAMEVCRMAAPEHDASPPPSSGGNQSDDPSITIGKVPDPPTSPPVQSGPPAKEPVAASAEEPDLSATPEPKLDDVARKGAAAAWAAARAAQSR